MQGFPYQAPTPPRPNLGSATGEGALLAKCGVWGEPTAGLLLKPLIKWAVALAFVTACGPALSESARSPLENGQKNPGPASAGEKRVAYLSKFEARRIRHNCQGEINKTSLAGAAKSAALTNCFYANLTARRAWNDCKRKASAKNTDRKARDDAARACFAEKQRQKADSDRRG